MFNFKDVKTFIITPEFILSRISQYDIFKYYCKNFVEIGKVFKSELRSDRNPSCSIMLINNSLFYKDFATGEFFNCFKYIKVKYMCNFDEALTIICNDFNLLESSIKHDVNKINIEHLYSDLIAYKSKETVIKPFYRPWSIEDVKYWGKYGINIDLLIKYDVFPCKSVIINSNVYENYKNSLIYVYKFENEMYKVYRPLAEKYRWFTNTNKSVIQGIKQLSNKCNMIIITKSLKDVICYKLLGINAIAPQSETALLTEDIMDKLKAISNNIIVNYDGDKTGILASEQMCKKYNINEFFIEKHKDISDYIMNEGMDNAKRYINNKLLQYANTNS